MGRKLKILLLSLAAICALTFLAGRLAPLADKWWMQRVLQTFFYLLIAGVALLAMRRTDIKLELDFKNKKQYLIGLYIALALSLVIAIIPALLGTSLVGEHTALRYDRLAVEFLICMLAIGPVEELVFRIYVQDTLTGFLKKHKWIGVVGAAMIFGAWHIINGNWAQGLFTFDIGLVFGLCRHLIKDCGYLGLAFAHGLYDFLIALVRIFIVK